MHPCLACGACCAAFPVVFPKTQVVRHGGRVPDALVEPGPHPTQVRLRGTGAAEPRCATLMGPIGAARCARYDDRPDVCRRFAPSWEDGAANAYCDEARRRHGLPPLPPGWRAEDLTG